MNSYNGDFLENPSLRGVPVPLNVLPFSILLYSSLLLPLARSEPAATVNAFVRRL